MPHHHRNRLFTFFFHQFSVNKHPYTCTPWRSSHLRTEVSVEQRIFSFWDDLDTRTQMRFARMLFSVLCRFSGSPADLCEFIGINAPDIHRLCINRQSVRHTVHSATHCHAPRKKPCAMIHMHALKASAALPQRRMTV